MKLLVATGNKNKLLEFSRILSPLGIEIVSPGDVGVSADVEETGSTFTENARIKAQALYESTGLPTVADDSGLCVDALGGRPGVYSARYLDGAPQSEKNKALLKELENVPGVNRSACFVCSICCVIDNNTTITTDGRCQGNIAWEPGGSGGFGYDPIFLVGDKTFAELSDSAKDKISHRGMALREFAEKLRLLIEAQRSSLL